MGSGGCEAGSWLLVPGSQAPVRGRIASLMGLEREISGVGTSINWTHPLIRSFDPIPPDRLEAQAQPASQPWLPIVSLSHPAARHSRPPFGRQALASAPVPHTSLATDRAIRPRGNERSLFRRLTEQVLDDGVERRVVFGVVTQVSVGIDYDDRGKRAGGAPAAEHRFVDLGGPPRRPRDFPLLDELL